MLLFIAFDRAFLLLCWPAAAFAGGGSNSTFVCVCSRRLVGCRESVCLFSFQICAQHSMALLWFSVEGVHAIAGVSYCYHIFHDLKGQSEKQECALIWQMVRAQPVAFF